MDPTTFPKQARGRRAMVRAASLAGVGPVLWAATPTTVLGTVAAIVEGVPLVRIADAAPVAASVLGSLNAEQLALAQTTGAQVLLVTVDGDPARVVIIGVVGPTAVPSRQPVTATVDGRRVELTGQDDVVLRCGKASITLTRAGKVIIKGAYVVTEATGTNRIRGASVQIN